MMHCETCSAKVLEPHSSLGSEDDILQNLRGEGDLSFTDVSTIRKRLSGAQSDLDAYESEILRLQSRITTLTSVAGILRKRIEQTNFLLSPVRRLPNEILGDIFRESMPAGFVFASHSQKPAPPSFLNVCTRWRNVALSTPRIWTSLVLELLSGTWQPQQIFGNFSALGHYLSLSKASPLHVAIHAQASVLMFEDPGHGYDTLIDSISRESSRLASLTFTSAKTDMTASTAVERLNKVENFPRLRSLSVTCPVPESVIPSILKRSPNLTELMIISFPSSPGPFTALSTITHLTLIVRKDANVFKVLDMCPNLKSVMFSLEHDHSPNKEEVTALCAHAPHNIPSLHDLSVEIIKKTRSWGREDYFLLPTLLSSLTLPSITSITLGSSQYKDSFSGKQTSNPLCALTSLLNRSRSTLTSLTLDQLRITDTDVLTLLHLVSGLTHLNIREPMPIDGTDPKPIISHEFLKRLHSYDRGCTPLDPNSRRLVLPKLKHLSFTVLGRTFLAENEDQDLLGLFVSVVASRWLPEQGYGVECIRFVKLRVIEKRVDRGVWNQLKYIDGLEVVLEDEDESAVSV